MFLWILQTANKNFQHSTTSFHAVNSTWETYDANEL